MLVQKLIDYSLLIWARKYTRVNLPYIIFLAPLFPAPLVIPGALSVSFPISREQFTITWDESTVYMNETIDAYFVSISGPNDLCGNDSNTTLQRVTERSYTCTIQTPPQEGETYTFTVAAANCGGNLRGPESALVRLQGINKLIIALLINHT